MFNQLIPFTQRSFKAHQIYFQINSLVKQLQIKVTRCKRELNLTYVNNSSLQTSQFFILENCNRQVSFQSDIDRDISYRFSQKSLLQLNCLKFYENYCVLVQILDCILGEVQNKNSIWIYPEYRQEFNKLILYIQKIICLEDRVFKQFSKYTLLLHQIYQILKKKLFSNLTLSKILQKDILVLILWANKTEKSARFFNQITIQHPFKQQFSILAVKQYQYIEQKNCKVDLTLFIKKYLNRKLQQLEICLSCQKMIVFSKMSNHLKICKERYDIEELTEKLDAEINAKLQDVNSYITKIKKLQSERLKIQKESKQNSKSKWQKSRESFFKKQYKTTVQNRTINQFEDEQLRGNSDSDSQTIKPKKPLRKLNELKNDQLTQYLRLIEDIKLTGNKIKTLKECKKNELYQSLKTLKESTKPNVQKLAVDSNQIHHILNLMVKRMDILLKERKYQLKAKKQNGLDHENWTNFTNNVYQNLTRQKRIQKNRSRKDKNEIEQYYSDEEYSPRSTCGNEKNQMGLKDFKIIKILGKGKYGEVFLVKKKKTGIKYALKKIYIQNSKNYTQLQNLKNQHNIFEILNSPFLVKALYSFSEGDFHYFVMQYMPNGNFSQLLERQQRLYEYQAKLCLAELVLAIQHLHDFQIIHKDLKPQNIVIDQNGHLKITDFGLSQSGLLKRKFQEQKNKKLSNFIINQLKQKKCNEKQGENKKIVGSPYFMAPEVLNGQTISEMADWWSFGIIVYETLIGVPPFTGKDMQQIKQNIYKNQKWPSQIQFGNQDPQQMISYEAKDLIDELLTINPNKRLGRQFEDIKYHNFFYGINWDNLQNQKSQILELLQQRQSEDQQGYETDEQKYTQRSITSTNKGIKFYRRDILCSETLAQHQKSQMKYNSLNNFIKAIISKTPFE